MFRYSRRNVRGRRTYGKGYRQNGDLFIQLKLNFYVSSSQVSVNEYHPFTELLSAMETSVRGGEMPGGFLPEWLHVEFHWNRHLLEPSDEMVCRILDGGETVAAKVFDDQGYEYKFSWDDGAWAPKACRQPVPRELIRWTDGHVYWVLAREEY